MLLYLLCFLICNYHCGVGGTIAGCTGDGSQLVDQIHLSLVDEFKVCVMWTSTAIMESPTVRYFKGKCNSKKVWLSAHGAQKHSPVGEFQYLAELVNLESDSMYCYVIGETCDYSSHIQFKTPDPNNATFAALSDSGTLGNVTYVMENLSADSDVTLVLHPGDLSYGLTDDVWDKFGIVEPVARQKPYMIIPGNWDVKNNIALQAFVNRYPPANI